MNETSDMKPSKIPANAVLFLIFVIVSVVLKFVAGPAALIGLAPALFLAVKLPIDLVRWLKVDKNMRPKMTFPQKTALVLLIVLLAVGYFAFLIAHALAAP